MEDKNIQILFGKRIQEFRKKKGFTQAQFSEKIGIVERTLSKIECGQSFVTSKTLGKILSVLEVEAEEIFNFKHLKNIDELKNELMDAIQNETVDINLLYKFYKSIK